MKRQLWFWPSSEEVNDFPDPIAFDAEWRSWRADLAQGPSDVAEIFAREYIQNSWDTIQAEQEAGQAKNNQKGALRFSFVELTGDRAQTFSRNFGLDEFRDRYGKLSQKHKKDARLGESAILQAAPSDSIRLLICSESGGGGMWGHWYTGGKASLKGSLLRFALIQTASEKSGDGSGGSWGHGKKAIANASKCRTIGVYTCHSAKTQTQDKPGITRRFMGVAYWRRHQVDDREHVGLGVLGQLTQSSDSAWQKYQPLENGDADRFISGLDLAQLPLRNPDEFDQRGTSYIIVEPSFEPSDLCAAIERNWWPLIVQHKLPISLEDYSGREVLINPGSRKELVPFIDAFRVATGSGGSKGTAITIKHKGLEVGNLAVIADVDEGGFSYRSDVEDDTSLVALVRNDMVIAYQPFPPKHPGKPPFVRGALNVDRGRNTDASDLLKMAEPHLHNEWRTKSDGSTPRDAAEAARHVLAEIRKRVREVREEHAKPKSKQNLHFDVFASVLSGRSEVRLTRTPTTRPVVPREFRIHKVSGALIDANAQDSTKIRVSAIAQISLSDAALGKHNILKAEVKIHLGWKVLEEGDGGTSDPSLCDTSGNLWPDGFIEMEPGTAVGVLSSVPLTFEWRSSYYDDDWQVLPTPEVSLVRVIEHVRPVKEVEA